MSHSDDKASDDDNDWYASHSDDEASNRPDAPPPSAAPARAATALAGAAAAAMSRMLSLVALTEAPNALQGSPGIMKLLEAHIFRFSDFLTNSELDLQKLVKVRSMLAKRVDSTAESYKLATSARGYTLSGAAFLVTGLNNINCRCCTHSAWEQVCAVPRSPICEWMILKMCT